jgi:CHASE2 domain-containing sensor protein/tRNA A-37 threonylcarbamoyl transferase component Bud32
MHSLLSRLGGLSAALSLVGRPVFIASIAVSALIIGVRQFGILQELELKYFDQLIQLRPDEAPDPRLLIVTVTQEDIDALGKWPTTDKTLDQVLENLEKDQPRVIGLDIYRDVPVEPGNLELTTHLQANNNIIAVCKDGSSGEQGVGPPPTVAENRLGFSDIVVDPDGIVRRNLLTMTPEPKSVCPVNTSFDLQLALHYLEKEPVKLQPNPQGYLQLNSTIFTPLKADTGGYENINARGYQVLLNYRSRANVAQTVNFTDVLKGGVEPSWVKDRIVLIGVTASSSNDFFNTPYSRGDQQDLRMPGVLVHAQNVSQILSAVLDHRALIWTWAPWGEMLWVWGWSLVGGVLAWRINPWLLLVVGGATVVGLVGVCYVILTQGGWVPLVPPELALVATGACIVSYRGYRNLEQQSLITGIESQLEEQANFSLRGRYKIINRIGSGSFGKTYLAEDTDMPGKTYCVVKQLNPTHNDKKFLKIARRLFHTEAETLEKLGRHDQIPQLLAYFEQDQEFYLVQEFIKGNTLSEELIPGKCLTESQTVALLKDVLEVVDFIQSYNVIHRDIKPANIMRRESDGRLVLIDFGAVKLLQTKIADAQESYTVAIGTSGFAPPEQLSGLPEFSSDIYALGMLSIQALSGRSPTRLRRDWTTSKVMWRDYAQVSDELAAILDKMVCYDCRQRYQSAAEVLHELEHLLDRTADHQQ